MNNFLKLTRILRVLQYGTALLRYRLPAGIEHEPVLRLRKYKTIVDVGANRGQFTLVARHCCPCARIIAFEPLRRPAERFRAIYKNDNGIALHQVAIGAATRVVRMNVSAPDHSSSLLPITRLQSSVFPGTGPAGTETVRIERLDGILSNDDIESPALLKLDVQGYELEALKGCDRLLSAFNQVYAECSLLELYENQASAHDVIEFLTEHRFRLQGIYNVYAKDGAAVQGDFLFTQSTEPQNRNN